MTSRATVLLAGALLVSACLPGPELLEGTITARLVVTGADTGDLLVATAGGRTLTQTVADRGPVTMAFALPPGEHDGELDLLRGAQHLCGTFHFSVPAEGGADFSLHVDELADCEAASADAGPVPFDAGDGVDAGGSEVIVVFSRFEERTYTPNDCSGEVCGRTTVVRANGSVFIEDQNGQSSGVIEESVLAPLIADVLAPDADLLFEQGCENAAGPVQTTFLRETFHISGAVTDPVVAVVEEARDVTGCEQGLVPGLRGRLSAIRAMLPLSE